MAGFQQYPAPKRIYSSSYWNHTPNKISSRNGLFYLASVGLISLAFARYILIRSVTHV